MAEELGAVSAVLERRRGDAEARMGTTDPERALPEGWEEGLRPDGAAEESWAGGALEKVWREPYGVAAEAEGTVSVRPEGGAEPAQLIGFGTREHPAADRAPGGGTAAERGLAELYRQTVRAARPALPPLSGGGAERTERAREPGGSAGLTVDELDRAVRRDSRRYDGGLSIF